jgi:hypothetical protein
MTTVVVLATALAALVLALLPRFTDVPLWPRRRRDPDVREPVDWKSAPDLPDHEYRTLYALAVRRRDALYRAAASAKKAGLPVWSGYDVAVHGRAVEAGSPWRAGTPDSPPTPSAPCWTRAPRETPRASPHTRRRPGSPGTAGAMRG